MSRVCNRKIMIPRFISVWNAFHKKHYIQWVSDWLGRYRLSPSYCSIIIVHVDNIIPCFGNECFVRYTINGICNESVSVAHSITQLKGERSFISIIHSNIHNIIISVWKINSYTHHIMTFGWNISIRVYKFTLYKYLYSLQHTSLQV